MSIELRMHGIMVRRARRMRLNGTRQNQAVILECSPNFLSLPNAVRNQIFGRVCSVNIYMYMIQNTGFTKLKSWGDTQTNRGGDARRNS